MKSCRLAAAFAVAALLVSASALSFAQAKLPVPVGTKLDITLNTPLSTQVFASR